MSQARWLQGGQTSERSLALASQIREPPDLQTENPLLQRCEKRVPHCKILIFPRSSNVFISESTIIVMTLLRNCTTQLHGYTPICIDVEDSDEYYPISTCSSINEKIHKRNS